MRVVTTAIVLISVVSALIYIGYLWGRAKRPAPTVNEALVREHRRLLRESREAQMQGDLGHAAILDEAAGRVWSTISDRMET